MTSSTKSQPPKELVQDFLETEYIWKIQKALVETYGNIQVAFIVLDSNNDHFIYPSELSQKLIEKGICNETEKHMIFFNFMDRDEDGKISLPDWNAGFRILKQKIEETKVKITEFQKSNTSRQLSESINRFNESLEESKFENISFPNQSNINEIVNKYAPESSNQASKIESAKTLQFHSSQLAGKTGQPLQSQRETGILRENYQTQEVYANPDIRKKPNELPPDFDESSSYLVKMQQQDPRTGNAQLTPNLQSKTGSRLNFGPLDRQNNSVAKSKGDLSEEANENLFYYDEHQVAQQNSQRYQNEGMNQNFGNERVNREYDVHKKGSRGRNQDSNQLSPYFDSPIYQNLSSNQERPVEEEYELKFNAENNSSTGMQFLTPTSPKFGEGNKSSAKPEEISEGRTEKKWPTYDPADRHPKSQHQKRAEYSQSNDNILSQQAIRYSETNSLTSELQNQSPVQGHDTVQGSNKSRNEPETTFRAQQKPLTNDKEDVMTKKFLPEEIKTRTSNSNARANFTLNPLNNLQDRDRVSGSDREEVAQLNLKQNNYASAMDREVSENTERLALSLYQKLANKISKPTVKMNIDSTRPSRKNPIAFEKRSGALDQRQSASQTRNSAVPYEPFEKFKVDLSKRRDSSQSKQSDVVEAVEQGKRKELELLQAQRANFAAPNKDQRDLTPRSNRSNSSRGLPRDLTNKSVDSIRVPTDERMRSSSILESQKGKLQQRPLDTSFDSKRTPPRSNILEQESTMIRRLLDNTNQEKPKASTRQSPKITDMKEYDEYTKSVGAKDLPSIRRMFVFTKNLSTFNLSNEKIDSLNQDTTQLGAINSVSVENYEHHKRQTSESRQSGSPSSFKNTDFAGFTGASRVYLLNEYTRLQVVSRELEKLSYELKDDVLDDVRSTPFNRTSDGSVPLTF